MTTEEQRITIAEACGWTDFSSAPYEGAIQYGRRPFSCSDSWELPDYLNDLNAMHEAERTMGDPQLWVEYQSYLSDVMGHVGWIFHATAAQRAESFLKTLNLWKP